MVACDESRVRETHEGPAELHLQQARLERLERESTGAPRARALQLVEECFDILDPLPPGPVRARCLDLLVATSSDPQVALQVFRQLMARSLTGARRAARIRRQAAAIDDPVGALRSDRSAEPDLTEGRRHCAAAEQAAHAAGRLAGATPAWWDDAWRALRLEDAGLACAFLDGTALTIGDARPATELLAAIGDPRADVSAAAWGAAAAGDDPLLRGCLPTIVREPNVEARARVAGCARLSESAEATVRNLLADPHPGVRSAAALQLKERSVFGEPERAALRADAIAGSCALRYSALRALALGGASEVEDGSALVQAILDEAPERGPGKSAAQALAAWASGREQQRRLFARALDDRRWLVALGWALRTGELSPPTLPPEHAERLRLHALRYLGDDEASPAAAAVLRSYPTEELFARFSRTALSTSELHLLSVLAPAALRFHPALVAPLWSWIDDARAPVETRAAALEALGFIAPFDGALIERLAALFVGDLADPAYRAMARIAGIRA